MCTQVVSPNSPRKLSWQPFVAAFLVLGIYAFFLSATYENNSSSEYYHELTDGFLQGHLYINQPAPAGLLALKDPYDPEQNAVFRARDKIHDKSLYKGKLYLYFGATPVITLFLPYKLITGKHLPQPIAGFIFLGIGFLANCALLASKSRDFPKDNPSFFGFLIVSMGVANWCIILTVRMLFYEVAIAAGYCFLSMAILIVLNCTKEKKSHFFGLAISGLCFGLALGARPTLLLTGVALIWASAWPLDHAKTIFSWQTRISRAFAFGAPAGAIVTGLLWYNYTRFENPLEFGLTYQLAGTRLKDMHFFCPGLIWENFKHYFLTPPGIQHYFPYIKHAEFVPFRYAPGYVATLNEGMIGATILTPTACLAPIIMLLGTVMKWKSTLLNCIYFLTIVAACNYAFLGMAAGGASRYYVDFMPWLALASTLGIILILKQAEAIQPVRTLLNAGTFTACAFSICMASSYACEYNNRLLNGSYTTFRTLQALFSQPVEYLDQLKHSKFGSIEATLLIKVRPAGSHEVLLAGTNTPIAGCNQDFGIGILHLEEGYACMTVFHNQQILKKGQPFKINETTAYRVNISLGMLLPYFGHSSLPAMTAEQYHELKSKICVTINGRKTIEGYIPRMETDTPFPCFGHLTSQTPSLGNFSGEVLNTKWLDMKDCLAGSSP